MTSQVPGTSNDIAGHGMTVDMPSPWCKSANPPPPHPHCHTGQTAAGSWMFVLSWSLSDSRGTGTHTVFFSQRVSQASSWAPGKHPGARALQGCPSHSFVFFCWGVCVSHSSAQESGVHCVAQVGLQYVIFLFQRFKH